MKYSRGCLPRSSFSIKLVLITSPRLALLVNLSFLLILGSLCFHFQDLYDNLTSIPKLVLAAYLSRASEICSEFGWVTTARILDGS